MKLGDVLKKEREKRGLSLEEVVKALGVSREQYAEIEEGRSPAEEWGPRLAHIAIALETPTSRLLADSGRSKDCRPGQAGELIRRHRKAREKTIEEMVENLRRLASEAELPALTDESYRSVEAGSSPIETFGPILLNFAECIEQPVFNLFYPCGLPFQELDDYP